MPRLPLSPIRIMRADILVVFAAIRLPGGSGHSAALGNARRARSVHHRGARATSIATRAADLAERHLRDTEPMAGHEEARASSLTAS